MPQSSTSTITIEQSAYCLGISWIDISSDVDDPYSAVKGMLHLTSTEQFTMQWFRVSDTVEDHMSPSIPGSQPVRAIRTTPCRRHGHMIGLPRSQPQFAKGVAAASSPFWISAYDEMTATKMSPDADMGRTAINSSNRQRSVIAEN